MAPSSQRGARTCARIAALWAAAPPWVVWDEDCRNKMVLGLDYMQISDFGDHYFSEAFVISLVWRHLFWWENEAN